MSEKQRLANQRNGRKGGPKTAAGKARSAQNARKHGIFAASLTEEEAKATDVLLSELREDLQPEGPMAEILVQKIAFTWVQIQRCARAEGALVESAWRPNANSRPDGDLRTGSNLHLAPFNMLATTIARYDTTLTNRMLKLLNELKKHVSRKRRDAGEPGADAVGRPAGEPAPGRTDHTQDPRTASGATAPGHLPTGPAGSAQVAPESLGPGNTGQGKGGGTAGSGDSAKRTEIPVPEDSRTPSQASSGPSEAPRRPQDNRRATAPSRPPWPDGFYREEPEDVPNQVRRRW